jgi:alcohol dehydrogenase class IV
MGKNQNRSAGLRKFVAPEFVYGMDARYLAGQYARNYGASKVFIVTDPGVIAAGWADEILQNLDEFQLPYSIFSDVKPNPTAEQVQSGAEQYRAEECNLILALGGGSPIDCAKGIGIAAMTMLPVTEFEGVDQVPAPIPPLICIPTTAGSSADVSQFAIINDSHRQLKFAIISKTIVPDVSLIDPVTTTTMDRCLTACTGLDALTHAIEAYVSIANSPITDLHARQAIRLVWENLQPAVEEPANMQYRSQMMLASLYAGLAFSNSSLGAVHAMAHSLGGLLDLPHGECNALLLDAVIHYNYPKASDRYQDILEMFDHDRSLGKEGLVRAIRDLRSRAGIQPGLKSRGLVSKDLRQLAQNALNDPCMVTNPRSLSIEEVEAIYEFAA